MYRRIREPREDKDLTQKQVAGMPNMKPGRNNSIL